MTLIDRFLAEHPFFCALFEHERRILAHYIELYRCPKNSYLVLPNELQEVLWIVVRGRLAEYSEKRARFQDKTQKCHYREACGQDSASNPSTEDTSEETEAKKSGISHSNSDELQPPATAEIPANEDAEFSQKNKALLRYFYPGDLINVHALTEELIAQNEIISLEDDTQVLCMTAFHLAKLAQQQPKIHRALRPLYNVEGYLVSGLPMPVWQQMSEVPPPHTRNFGKQWLQRRSLLRSHNSWLNSIVASFVLGVMNIWQFSQLHWEAIPFFNVILALFSLLTLGFVVMQRSRCEYTLKRSLLHITERDLLGLSSKIKSYPLLSISQVELLKIPVMTRFFQFGGLRLHTYNGEVVQIFPIDRVKKWLTVLQTSLKEARELQEQLQNSAQLKQFQKWHKLQPELIKEIDYRNDKLEGRLQRSLRALLIQTGPIALLALVGLLYSQKSELYKIYLTIPLIALGLLLIFQVMRWSRYSWRINEEFLFCSDKFLGYRGNRRIPIREIQDIRLEYLNILGFGTISLTVGAQLFRLQNLKHPQNILDEIESLRHSAKNLALLYRPEDFLTQKQLEMYHDFSRSHRPADNSQ